MIVNNIRKVIRWIAVRFHNNEITFRLHIERFFTVNQIVERFITFLQFESAEEENNIL